MLKKKKELDPNDISNLKEMISNEKARLRSRLANTTGSETWESSPSERPQIGRLHSVFSACFGN
jgi:hypothetical protein